MEVFLKTFIEKPPVSHIANKQVKEMFWVCAPDMH